MRAFTTPAEVMADSSFSAIEFSASRSYLRRRSSRSLTAEKVAVPMATIQNTTTNAVSRWNSLSGSERTATLRGSRIWACCA